MIGIAPVLSEKVRHDTYKLWLERTKGELRPKGRAYLEGYMEGINPIIRFLYKWDILSSPIKYDAIKSLLEEMTDNPSIDKQLELKFG